MVIPICTLICISVFSWYKGNANKLEICSWSLLEWAIYTSIPISLLGLWAYWQLLERCGAWTTSIVYSIIGLSVTVMMNSVYYGFSAVKVAVLVLIVSTGIIVGGNSP